MPKFLSSFTLVSNRESRQAGKISCLALIEIAVFTSVSLAFTSEFGPYLFSISCVAVPVLLLRSPDSHRRLREAFIRKFDSLWIRHKGLITEATYSPWSLWKAMMLATLFSIEMFWLRFHVFVVELIRDRYAALVSLPGNWRKLVFSTDTFTPPQILPEIDQIGGRYNLVTSTNTASRAVHLIISSNSVSSRVSAVIAGIIFFPLAYLPPLVFRWSIKSTFIIWWGLLMACEGLRTAPSEDLNEQELIDELKSVYSYPSVWIRLIGSLFAPFIVVSKLAGYNISIAGPSDFANTLIHELIAPQTIPPWQWCASVASILFIAYFLFAIETVRRHGRPEQVPMGAVRKVRRWLPFAQTCLAGYPMWCSLYILISSISEIELPPLGSRWFPLP